MQVGISAVGTDYWLQQSFLVSHVMRSHSLSSHMVFPPSYSPSLGLVTLMRPNCCALAKQLLIRTKSGEAVDFLSLASSMCQRTPRFSGGPSKYWTSPELFK